MDLNLKGKRALITGGSHGIGRNIAYTLATEGCDIAICARGQENIDETVERLISIGIDAFGVSADVLDKDGVDKVLHGVKKRWGGVDILVNNVGGGGRWGSEIFEDTPEDVWIDVYNKNNRNLHG